jgi:chemotaxis protein MotB
MDTYGDLVTLLLCFFVLLFAMSTVEESKYNAFVQALSNRFGTQPINLSAVTDPNAPEGDDYGDTEPTEGETLDPVENLPAEMRQLYEDVSEYVEQQNLAGEVTIEAGESGAVFIRLSENLLFGGNSSVLRSDAMDFLDYLGGGLVAASDGIFQVNILGHTGSQQGSAVDDWMLSSERSGRVASYLERAVGFSPYKMHTLGYGRHYPVADNNTIEGLAKNRRVDMVIVSNDAATFYGALAESQQVYFPDDDTQFFEGAPDELPGNALKDIAPTDRALDLENLTDDQLRALYDAVNSA